jgi:hypothetical protein
MFLVGQQFLIQSSHLLLHNETPPCQIRSNIDKLSFGNLQKRFDVGYHNKKEKGTESSVPLLTNSVSFQKLSYFYQLFFANFDGFNVERYQLMVPWRQRLFEPLAHIGNFYNGFGF